MAVSGRLLRGRNSAERQVWIAPPSEIDQWWRNRREMTLVPDGESWRIKGPGSERARVAYARLKDGSVVYEVDRIHREDGGRVFRPGAPA